MSSTSSNHQNSTLDLGTVPRGWNQALAQAVKTPALRRRRTSRIGDVLPGISTKGPLLDALPEIVAGVDEALGKQEGLNASYALCVTGRIPRPLGVPHLQTEVRRPTPLCFHTFSLITELTRRMYSERLTDRGFSLPNKSSVGFPYYQTADEGLLVRRAYIESFANNISEISDLLSAGDWEGLMYGGKSKRFLPMFPVTSVNWRLQPDKALDYSRNGLTLGSVSWKKRQIFDAGYEPCVMHVALSDSTLCRAMRSRPVCAVSATVNMLYQANMVGMRGRILQFPLWHITSVSESHLRACKTFKDGVTHTYDFSQMDHTMAADVWTAYHKGLEQAGAPKSLLNLASSIRYSPFLVTEDDYSREPPRPVRLVGDVFHPDQAAFDLGNRSGEADTDVFNKICGTCAHLTAAIAAGCMHGIDIHSTPQVVIQRFLDTWARCVPDSRDTGMFEGNCGDDQATRFASESVAKRYEKALSEFAPYWDVTVEKDSQLLGWRLNSNGQAVPYLGRSASNFLCPERFYTDPMRRDFFMIGVKARDEHYSVNPEWNYVYRPLIEKVVTRHCHVSPFAASGYSIPTLEVTPINAAEMELLYNPDAILYKYDEADIRPEYADKLHLYYAVDAETTNKLTLE